VGLDGECGVCVVGCKCRYRTIEWDSKGCHHWLRHEWKLSVSVPLVVDKFGGMVGVGSAQTERDVNADGDGDWMGREGSGGWVSMQAEGGEDAEGEKVVDVGVASGLRMSMFLQEWDHSCDWADDHDHEHNEAMTTVMVDYMIMCVFYGFRSCFALTFFFQFQLFQLGCCVIHSSVSSLSLVHKYIVTHSLIPSYWTDYIYILISYVYVTYTVVALEYYDFGTGLQMEYWIQQLEHVLFSWEPMMLILI
jgi:hypothetical protein